MPSKKKKNQPKPGHLLGRTQEDADAVNMMMYDPGEQHLDLTKAEKLRTTALLMAINYVRETICHDAEMYRALRQDNKELVPATVPWILQCSVDFEMFLLGHYSARNVAMVKRGMELEKQREAPAAPPAPAAVDPVGVTGQEDATRD